MADTYAMKAEDIAAYFTKKIGKAMSYDLLLKRSGRDQRFHYTVETVAVRNNVWHAIVEFKYVENFGQVKGTRTAGDPRHCGAVAVPFQDGDTMQLVLDMAMAGADPEKLDDEAISKTEGDAEAFAEALTTVLDRLHGNEPTTETRPSV